jgi:paraquat-inducible protein B
MKRKPFPFWVLGLIAALVGGMVAVNLLSQKAQNQNVQVFDSHDHDHDGKPDHDANTHN